MRSIHRQRGVTLLQLMVSMVLITTITMSIIQVGLGQARTAEFERAIIEATVVAQAADREGQRVTATAVNGTTGVYTYTHGQRVSAWTNASTLAASYPTVTTTSPYGTTYQYINDVGLARARFVVPAAAASMAKSQVNYAWSDAGSGTVFLEVPASRSYTKSRSRYMQWVKSTVFLETTR